MKNNNFINSFYILFFLIFWTIFNIFYSVIFEENIKRLSSYEIKVLSLNISTLKKIKTELKNIKLEREYNLPEIFRKYGYLSRELIWILNQKARPLYSNLSLLSNKYLSQELFKKYNLENVYQANKSTQKLPNILLIKVNGEKFSSKVAIDQEKIFSKYQSKVEIKSPSKLILQKLLENRILKYSFWFGNFLFAFFFLLFINSLRKSVLYRNNKAWRILRNLGYIKQHRKRNMFFSSFIFFLIPIIFNVLLFLVVIKYNLFFRTMASYSTIVGLFVYLPLIEIGTIWLSNIYIRVRFGEFLA